MDNFTKTVRISTVPAYGGSWMSVYAQICYQDGKLSISGVEGPTNDGNCKGSCGQIVMHEWQGLRCAPGWTQAMVAQFREVWDKWHLNDMKAGTPEQTAYLESLGKYESYDWACTELEKAGLLTAPHPVTGEPYRYGTAWLKTEVPGDVLEWLRGLPDTDEVPAWV